MLLSHQNPLLSYLNKSLGDGGEEGRRYRRKEMRMLSALYCVILI